MEMDDRARRHVARDLLEPRPGVGYPVPEWFQVDWVLEIERDLARRARE